MAQPNLSKRSSSTLPVSRTNSLPRGGSSGPFSRGKKSALSPPTKSKRAAGKGGLEYPERYPASLNAPIYTRVSVQYSAGEGSCDYHHFAPLVSNFPEVFY